MKLSFSTKDVNLPSFRSLCRLAYNYGFAGLEVHDVKALMKNQRDCIFYSDKTADAKRWLRNRGASICALSMPTAVNDPGTTEDDICKYVNYALMCGTDKVILFFDGDFDFASVYAKLSAAVKIAEKHSVELLFETKGVLKDTAKAVEFLNSMESTCVGAAWCVRETYFEAGEIPEDTIRNLGAYIRFVRLGDRLNGEDVLIGEGEIRTKYVICALESLNYDGFISAEWNGEITDPDIVLTHFCNYVANIRENRKKSSLYYNRDNSGSFPWKKYTVLDKTFSQVLDTMAETYPDQICFKYTTLDYTRTYAQFRRDVDSVAAALISLGVKPGGHVAVWATNIPQWFMVFWATVKIGAVLVTVNTAYKISEIEYLLRQSDTHTLFTVENFKDTSYKEILRELCPELASLKPGAPLYSKRLPFLRNIVSVGFEMDGCLSWDDFMLRSSTVSLDEVRHRAAAVKPEDVANMQYTSGTTGFPKGVMLTHSNIINNGKTIGDRMDLSTADRMMIQVPMFHCFGMVLSMTSMMTHGGTLSPLPYFSPKSSLACINNEKITCFNGVPTMFIAMFSHEDFSKTDFSYMRTGIMAGANCPPELMRRAADEMNMREIISVYGQTEASPGCTMGEVNEPIDLRVETVGSAFPGIECKIINPETGEEMPDGENGEFVVRGFNVMKGYYKMPKETAKAIDSKGWLHSGDICCRTSEGYYKVTGRLKDMIIRGGENIYPREIEEFYLTHPKIRDVQVVGVPDKTYGEEACAWIRLKEGETADEKELKDFGFAHMATHKVPRYFIFAEKFPMNAAGKILKYKMRDDSIDILKIN